MDLDKLPDDTLRSFIEDNRGGLTDDDFVNRYLDTVIDGLMLNPLLYRTYGGYWWPLKRLLIARPDYKPECGDSFDTDLNQLFSHSEDILTVAAAYLEQAKNLTDKMLSDNHFIYDAAGGESFELTLEDPDMERLLFAERFAQSL
jgi:hypothetical protein